MFLLFALFPLAFFCLFFFFFFLFDDAGGGGGDSHINNITNYDFNIV